MEKPSFGIGHTDPAAEVAGKAKLRTRAHLESNERKLFLELTEKGWAMRQAAEKVPCVMHDCISLENDD